MHFIDRKIDDLLLHPCRLLEFLNELTFDVGDNLVAKHLCLFGEGLLNKEAGQDPTKTIIDVIDASSPTFWS